MKENIEKAIETLTKNIKDNTEPDEALKFTQAALNLAHTRSTIMSADQSEKS